MIRRLVCAVFGHDVYKDANVWKGIHGDCHRCGAEVKWLPSFGWVRK